LIHLFRREKPEEVTVRCSSPTVCHRTNTLLCSLERRREFGKRSALVDHQCFPEARCPRRGCAKDATTVSWAMPPALFATGSPFFSARKSGRCGRAR
jgi:hypothetical protein